MFSELSVLKEIPGYQAIMRGVVKNLIQILIEQLSAQTGEESVILTASINDGTLSHLGSESGKTFLEENEDIKSKFLGFCLKRQHQRQSTETNISKLAETSFTGPEPHQKIMSSRKVANQRRGGMAPSSPYTMKRNKKSPLLSVTTTSPYTEQVQLTNTASNIYPDITDTMPSNSSTIESPFSRATEQEQEISSHMEHPSPDDISTEMRVVKQEPLDEDEEVTDVKLDRSVNQEEGGSSFEDSHWEKNTTGSWDYYSNMADMNSSGVDGLGILKSIIIEPLNPETKVEALDTQTEYSTSLDMGQTAQCQPRNKTQCRQKRSELTVNQKLEVLRYAEDNPNVSQRQLSKKFGLGKTTVFQILHSKEHLLNTAECDREKSRCNKTGKFSEMNELVLQWYHEARLIKPPISRSLILEKAGEIAISLGISDFKKSNGWLCRFIKRNDIKLFSD